MPVVAQLALDVGEPDVREVVGLDGALEVVVDAVDLPEDALRLGLLRRYRGRLGGGGADGQEGRSEG